jgi:hypothetical protein
MITKRTSLVVFTAIVSITIIGIMALTRNTDTTLNLNFGQNKSLTIEGKYSLLKTNDCLPSGESSHHLNCDNH